MKKKPKKKANRNAFAIVVKTRKGGPMANKKAKRKNGKNKQKELLDENY